MLTLSAKIRKEFGKKVKPLRQRDVLPAVLYGHKVHNLNLEVDLKDFEKIYHESGESSLLSLEVEGKNLPVLIHDVQFDPLTEKPIHIDFYQPSLKEEIEAKILLVFEGEAPAVKELGGTFVKNISELAVKAIATQLTREIRIDISNLKTFEDNILIKHLTVPKGVRILRNPEDILAWVSPPEKIEEELAKPIEEKVEEVKEVEKEKKEKEAEEKEGGEKTEGTKK
jgi:large subunit ribosomal protein L25